MGSSYFGEPNMGSDQRGSGSSSSSSSSNSSSRKGKKGNSDKPKQPQRGLGVAQLEKIRLHGQMVCGYHPPLPNPYPSNFNNEDLRVQSAYSSIPSSSSFSYSTSTINSSSASYGFHPNIVMGLGDYERANTRYGDSQPTNTARWDPGNSILETHPFGQPSMTSHFLNPHIEESQVHTNTKKNRSRSMGSSSQNSESGDSQELDLELRLSL